MSYQPTPYEVDLRAWLVRNVPAGVTVIYARQSGPLPNGDVVTLGNPRLRPVGTPDGRVLDEVTTPDHYRGQRLFTWAGSIDVNVYSANARAIAQALAESMWMPSEIELGAGDTVVQRVGQLQDVSSVVGSEWEGRSLLEVTFGHTSLVEYDAEAVETAEATPELG